MPKHGAGSTPQRPIIPRMQSRLFDILVCPVTKASLRYDRDAQELICQASKLAYPVRDGIPVLLESAARKLDGDDAAASVSDPAQPTS